MTIEDHSLKTRRVLVVEDDPDLAHLTCLHLEDEGYQVQVEGNGSRALKAAQAHEFDLVLLDLTLPGMSGLDICRELRRGTHYVPIIVVTARGTEIDRILGLEIGADDYLSKPLSLRELSARVRAMFRRVDGLERDLQTGRDGSEGSETELVRGDLRIDPSRRSVWLRGDEVELTAKEFDLLMHFALRPGRVYTRNDLVDRLWGPGYVGYEHTVNSHINRLRSKINGDGPRQLYIETVWGVGYRFSEKV